MADDNDGKKAVGAAAAGAAAGGAAAAAVGNVGLVGAFGGVAITAAPFVAAGAVLGLAGFGIYKALGGGKKKKT